MGDDRINRVARRGIDGFGDAAVEDELACVMLVSRFNASYEYVVPTTN